MIAQMEQNDRGAIADIWKREEIAQNPFLKEERLGLSHFLVCDVYLNTGETLVEKEEGKIDGFINLLEKSCISALFVVEKKRGMGIGTRILQHAKELYDILMLTVYEENKEAIHFFEKNGFGVVGKQANKNSGHPEVIMQWKKRRKVANEGKNGFGVDTCGRRSKTHA